MLTFVETSAPGVRAAKYRDLNFLHVRNAVLVFACDSVGSVGTLPFDEFHRTPAEAGHSYLKSAWMELLACGAKPLALYGDFCYRESDRETQICDSIRAELRASGIDPTLFHASFGESADPKCSAFGLTAVGCVPASGLRLGSSRGGDAVFAIGRPTEKDDQTRQCTPQDVLALLGCEAVHEILPCGSHGIRGELLGLTHTSRLTFTPAADCALEKEFDLSCGPAGTLLVTAAPDALAQIEALVPSRAVTQLGTLSGTATSLELPASTAACSVLDDGSLQIGGSLLKTDFSVSLGKGMKRFDGPVRVPSENIVRRLTAALIDRTKAAGAEPVLIVNNLNFSMKGGGKASITAIRELIEPFQMKPDYQLTGSTEDNHEPAQSGYDIRVFALELS